MLKAKIILGLAIILLWAIVLAVSYRCWKFVYKKNLEKFKKDLDKLEQNEQQEKQKFRQASKPLTQQSFEEWKAEKRKRDQGGFIDLDAEISLPWRRAI